MKVESIAECSLGAFCNTFGLHKAIIGLEHKFWYFLEWPLKTSFTVRNIAQTLIIVERAMKQLSALSRKKLLMNFQSVTPKII